MEVCLGQRERTLSGDEQRLGQNRGKKEVRALLGGQQEGMEDAV